MKHIKKLTAIFLAVFMTLALSAMAFATDVGSEMGERNLTLELGSQSANTKFHVQEDSAYSPVTYTADEKGVVSITLGDSTNVRVISQLSVIEATNENLDDESKETDNTDAEPVEGEDETAEGEEAEEVEATEPTEEPTEEKLSFLEENKTSLIITLVGGIVIGGYFLFDKVYLKNKNKKAIAKNDDYYDDYE